MSTPIRKILIANRGEIAVRVMRACRELGIRSVAVFSDCDAAAYHVRMADEAYAIGASPSAESYLNQERLIATAKKCGAEAIHPGYGFLAENASFARRCVDAGLIFIGPRPETIALLGDKLEARKTALAAGLPVIPGETIDARDSGDAARKADGVGWPVLVKAAAGGGGKGMRVVRSKEHLAEALRSASSEAAAAFGDGRVYIERYLERPRHIEIQILCDQHGHCVHLGERECSIQRRHQKLIEESPSPIMTEEFRQKMGAAALEMARKAGYVGAGTVEFMVDEQGRFYFLEVNTRLQVEHPVTEMVTGLDLVKEQVAIARGERLAYSQDEITFRGHAIEFRICAENPEDNFMPSTGVLKNYRIPAGPGVRVDSGVVIFSEVPVYYDPLIAKLIVWGRDRSEAISRARRALEEYRISGVDTTLGFHLVIINNEKFAAGDFSTRFIEEEYPDSKFSRLTEEVKEIAAITAALHKFVSERRLNVAARRADIRPASAWASFHRRRNLGRFGGRR